MVPTWERYQSGFGWHCHGGCTVLRDRVIRLRVPWGHKLEGLQGSSHLHRAVGCRWRIPGDCVGHCLGCGFCSLLHRAQSMESTDPTHHLELGVAPRSLVVTASPASHDQHTSSSHPDSQSHPPFSHPPPISPEASSPTSGELAFWGESGQGRVS